MSALRSTALLVIPCAFAACAAQGVPTATVEPLRAANGQDRDLTPVNAAADPCEDFVSFACGVRTRPGGLEQEAQTWTDPTPILRKYLDRPAATGSHSEGTSEAMVRKFYARCTETGARSRGLAEVRSQAEQFDRPRTLTEFARELGAARASGQILLISLEPYWDAIEENGLTVARIRLAGPALRRSAYADVGRVSALREHWLRLAKIAGFLSAPEVESALRVDQWLAESPDPDAEERWDAPEPLVGSSERRTMVFPWDEYLAGVGLSQKSPVRPAAADAVKRIDGLTGFPLDVLRSYVRVILVERASKFLSWPFVEEEVRFHEDLMRDGPTEPLVPADYCFNMTARSLDTWLAQAYLPSMVSPAGEQAARRMFGPFRRTFEQLVTGASWMDEVSRARALAKVSATTLVFIDEVKKLDVTAPDPQRSFWSAFRQIVASQTAKLLAEVGRPSVGPPLLVTWDQALYSNLSNQIWVSPVIVRPPFLRMADRDPVTYGAFGVILGHELAHTLSVVGKRYDGAGILRKWWSSATVAGFDDRAGCLTNQLKDFVGGPSTGYPLDEFVADLGGVEIAVRVLDRSVSTPQPEMTRERRRTFFTAYAQQSCGWYGDVDTLPPEAVARVNGVVANVPEFAEAFGCKPGSSMAPVRRCSIW